MISKILSSKEKQYMTKEESDKMILGMGGRCEINCLLCYYFKSEWLIKEKQSIYTFEQCGNDRYKKLMNERIEKVKNIIK